LGVLYQAQIKGKMLIHSCLNICSSSGTARFISIRWSFKLSWTYSFSPQAKKRKFLIIQAVILLRFLVDHAGPSAAPAAQPGSSPLGSPSGIDWTFGCSSPGGIEGKMLIIRLGASAAQPSSSPLGSPSGVGWTFGCSSPEGE